MVDVRADEGDVRIDLVLTDPPCFFTRYREQFISEVLLPLRGVETVEVWIDPDRLWTPKIRCVRREPTTA